MGVRDAKECAPLWIIDHCHVDHGSQSCGAGVAFHPYVKVSIHEWYSTYSYMSDIPSDSTSHVHEEGLGPSPTYRWPSTTSWV